MKGVTIPKGEVGVIRVFAVNRPIPDMNRALKHRGKPALVSDLLGQTIPDNGAELFAVSDLTGVGLPGYLAEGYAIPTDTLSTDRAKLDGLDGYLLLLFSAAFDGAATTLNATADLSLIGTYAEPQPDRATVPLDSDAAQPYTGTPAQTPAQPPRGRAGSASVGVAFVVLVALILWWFLT